jgi:hypothetical protein
MILSAVRRWYRSHQSVEYARTQANLRTPVAALPYSLGIDRAVPVPLTAASISRTRSSSRLKCAAPDMPLAIKRTGNTPEGRTAMSAAEVRRLVSCQPKKAPSCRKYPPLHAARLSPCASEPARFHDRERPTHFSVVNRNSIVLRHKSSRHNDVLPVARGQGGWVDDRLTIGPGFAP